MIELKATGERKGEFPGMLKTRTFDVVLVSKDHGTGLNISKQIDKVIHYSGQKEVIKF